MYKELFKNLNEFEIFKDSQTVIITDIDGTISEISIEPQDAVVSESMKKLLIKIVEKYQLLVIITGRSLDDAYKMVDIPEALYIGNHGMEYMNNGTIKLDKKPCHTYPKYQI